MAKKDKAPKAPKGPKNSFMDKVTTLVVVLFFASLAVAHLS